MDLWLDFAKIHRVEALYVDLEYAEGIIAPKGGVAAIKEKLYWAPRCLYSCSSLQKLYLKGCNLQLPIDNMNNWHQLKYLRIDGFELCGDLIKRVLSGSPQLEVFILCLMENHENLCIESDSLKNLHIDKYLYFEDDDAAVDTELAISTPNLENLDLVGIPYSKCLMNVPSLIRASLLFDAQSYYKHTLFSGNDFVGETLMQILPAIRHVERVTLSHWCAKAVGAMNKVYRVSPFPNVKVLELNSRLKEYEQIAGLCENFPNLETLVLQHENGKQYISLLA